MADAVVLLGVLTCATAGAAVGTALVTTVVKAGSCVPNAIHPPSVPTIAAVATADLRRAANC